MFHTECYLTLQPGDFDVQAWSGRRDFVKIREALDKIVMILKAEGVTRFGATGYCFGGLFETLLCQRILILT
jgi:dienelactone hydrolase